MASGRNLCAAVIVVSSLVLAGCSTTGWLPETSARQTGGERAPGTTNEVGSAAAMDKLAKAHAHYATGVIHDIRNEPGLALAEFSEAALGDLDNESLVLDVSDRFLIQKQPEKALAFLTNAVTRSSASGAVFARLGLAYAQLGNTDLAVEANRTAVKKLPRSLDGYRNLFHNHLEGKRQDEAFKVLQQAMKQPDTDAEFLVELAELWANFGLRVPSRKAAADAEALVALERAAKLKPTNLNLRLKLADGFNALGATTKAAPIYLDLLKQPGQEGEVSLLRNVVRVKLADLYLRGRDRARATEQLEAIVRDDPANARGYYLLGSIAFEEKKMTNAVEYFGKTVLLNSDFEPAYYDLASTQINLNQTEEALATLEKARAKFPDRSGNFVAEYLRGLAHSRRKAYGDAIKCFTAAEVIGQATEPKRLNEFFYYQLGSVYERSGGLSQAEKYFEKCLQLASNFAEAMNYLGYMWAERGINLEKARELIEKAVKAEPKSAAYLDSLGWVLFKLNQPAAALEQLLKAIACAETPDATICDHLGDVYAASGQLDKAREAWRKSLELEPNDQIRGKLERASDK
jgi:tetratricopeptide (TPR) repeat protein